MKLSVVTTLYNSERYVSVLLRKLIDIIVTDLKLDNTDFEIIMVDDGSSDSSLKVALDEKQKYKDVNIKIIQLSKNFGHHNALMAGLSVAKGNYVYITDADLEVHPKYIKDFYDLILESNADVVYGIAKEREGGFIRKYLGGIFWKVFNFFSDTNVPESMANERLMSRKYVDALLQIKENNFFIGGIWYWLGFNQVPVSVEKRNIDNVSSYTKIKRIKLAAEAITSFSHKPLYYLFIFGFLISLLSFLVVIYLIIKKILHPATILIGYTSLMAVVIFSTGVIVMSLGIIGIYIGKLFKEVKNRPLYIVKEIFE